VSKNQTGLIIKGITEEMVNYVLQKSGEPHQLVSLSDKTIRDCTGCCGCTKDNVCVLKDDWAEIRDKMYTADVIVFGAPNHIIVLSML